MKRCSFGIPTVFDLPPPCPFAPYFPTVYSIYRTKSFFNASDLFPLFCLSSPAGRVDAPDGGLEKRGTRLGFGHKRVYGLSLRSAVGRCRAMNRMRDLSDRKHGTRLNGNRPSAQSKRLQKKKQENAVRLQESVQSALYSGKSALPSYPAGVSLDSRAASGHSKDESGGGNAAVGLSDGVAFTIERSGKSGRYFEYVVPSEGFWRQEGRRNSTVRIKRMPSLSRSSVCRIS